MNDGGSNSLKQAHGPPGKSEEGGEPGERASFALQLQHSVPDGGRKSFFMLVSEPLFSNMADRSLLKDSHVLVEIKK